MGEKEICTISLTSFSPLQQGSPWEFAVEAPCSVAMETALRRLQAEESSVLELLSSQYGELALQLFMPGETRSLKSFFEKARTKACASCGRP